ncbi:hypothetical protein [Mycolicibacterium fortuitum]|uniref:hypothetical protein n=1 Tax=Mycolicibacterium fortuitum TaxID=1766 RepID=UPI001F48E73D|nr:hypothetical protein [Mycolicibacterium fortuitum]
MDLKSDRLIEIAVLVTANLVNAAEYAIDVNGRKAYYFSTPSGRWQCAILPRDRAGCQPAGGAAMAVTGAPETVPDPTGGTAAPNALVLVGGGAAASSVLTTVPDAHPASAAAAASTTRQAFTSQDPSQSSRAPGR